MRARACVCVRVCVSGEAIKGMNLVEEVGDEEDNAHGHASNRKAFLRVRRLVVRMVLADLADGRALDDQVALKTKKKRKKMSKQKKKLITP
jgi:hypothetical protein